MKSLFGVIVIMCFIWIMLVQIVSCGTTTTTTTTKGNFKRLDVIPRDRDHVVHHHHHLHSDPNFMSKRKVPNGPDPIHNRRAGKSGQPPGRA
ncbi:hypothetical protein AQUCO_00200398v1 [Aquilegia coerulea]|uniref:Uncharacterized protein n=1 Tax=Aquilegia coerulea TaxID=218851 RepID=A0A2G5F325_AQUCA|nr:hypothetical protein AQUCO_00200398v1 [Aquilegia coerulea]